MKVKGLVLTAMLALSLAAVFIVFPDAVPPVKAEPPEGYHEANLFEEEGNEGFEYGNKTNWDLTSSWTVESDGNARTGEWYAGFSYGFYIERSISPPVATNNITDFYFWASQSLSGTFTLVGVTIYYNDSTSDYYSRYPNEEVWAQQPNYELQDDATYITGLDPNKFVNKVKFREDASSGSQPHTHIDDVYFGVYVQDPPVYFQSRLLDAENIDDAGADWVFTDWKYYTFETTLYNDTVQGDVTEAALYFDVSTGYAGTVTIGLYSDGTDWTLASSLTDELLTRYGEPVLMKAGDWTEAATYVNVTWLLFFNDQVLDVWASAIDLFSWGNTTAGEIAYGESGSDAFRIYSKGAFTMNYVGESAYAGKVVGEEWAAMFGYEGEAVDNEIWFRDLQHIKMLPECQFYAGYETFTISTAVEYSVGEGEWLTGWKSIVDVEYVSYTGILAGNVWINMTVSWYQGDGAGGYTFVKVDPLYMFYRGTVATAGDVGNWRFWIDEWFNNINASSTGGGRISAFEYPVKDTAADWYRWLSSNWGVKDDVNYTSSYMADLIDTDGNVMSSERIKMVRVRQSIAIQDEDAGQLVVLHNYAVMDYTRSPDFPLTGIQTPVFDEPKMPSMGNTGLLGAIFSVFSSVGQWLSENLVFGGLNLWGNFVAFLDTIAGWLGAPGAFTAFLAWIGDAWANFTLSLGYVWTVFSEIFVFLGTVFSGLFTVLTEAFAGFSSFINTTLSFVQGGVGGAANLWTDLGITTWLTVFLVFYPMYLIFVWEEEGEEAVFRQLNIIWSIMSWLAHFFMTVISTVISVISGLVESIPVAE